MLQECRSVTLFKRHAKISEGSYGVVYRGEEVSTGQVVALKKVRPALNPRTWWRSRGGQSPKP